MSSLYREAPNTVRIVLSDETGEEERYIVGQSIEEVIAIVEQAFEIEPTKPAKKARKKRRTKAEMAATAETNGSGDTTEIPEGVAPPHRKSKKELATVGSVWPK